MMFLEQGRKFRCNICGAITPVPDHYMCYLGPDGRRRDADERPELSRGTVEYEAPAEFSLGPPMDPTYFFLIDVSEAAIRSGRACRVVGAQRLSLSLSLYICR